MSTNIQIRRRGEKVTAIRIRAATMQEALSKLSACIAINPRDTALAAISNSTRLIPVEQDGHGWWIVRPA